MKRGKLFIKCQVLGEDSFSLIEKLHKRGVYAKDITFSAKKTILSVDFADRKNLFAICRNMCYNIRILKYYGEVCLLKKAFSRLGLTLGLILFLTFSILCDGYVGKISYVGSGKELSPEISAMLTSEGIRENSFLKTDLKSVERKILQSTSELSFITLTKKGRILTVESYLAKQSPTAIDLKKPSVISQVKGRVVAINLLSGTCLVSVGDEVKEGDVLIDGYYLSDEEKILTYALGEVEIEVEYSYLYQSFASGKKYENRAIFLARQNIGDKDVTSVKTKSYQKDGKTVYEVTLNYLVTAT